MMSIHSVFDRLQASDRAGEKRARNEQGALVASVKKARYEDSLSVFAPVDSSSLMVGDVMENGAGNFDANNDSNRDLNVVSPDPQCPMSVDELKAACILLGEKSIPGLADKSFEQINYLFQKFFFTQQEALLKAFCSTIRISSTDVFKQALERYKRRSQSYDFCEWDLRTPEEEFFWQIRSDIKLISEESDSGDSVEKIVWIDNNKVYFHSNFDNQSGAYRTLMFHILRQQVKFYDGEYSSLMKQALEKFQESNDLTEQEKSHLYNQAKQIINWYEIFTKRRACVAVILDLYKTDKSIFKASNRNAAASYLACNDQKGLHKVSKPWFPIHWQEACQIHEQLDEKKSLVNYVKELQHALEHDYSSRRYNLLAQQVNGWLDELSNEAVSENLNLQESLEDASSLSSLDVEIEKLALKGVLDLEETLELEKLKIKKLEVMGVLDSAKVFEAYNAKLAGRVLE